MDRRDSDLGDPRRDRLLAAGGRVPTRNSAPREHSARVDAFRDELLARGFRPRTVEAYEKTVRPLGAAALEASAGELLARWASLAPNSRATYLAAVKAFRKWFRSCGGITESLEDVRIRIDAPSPRPLAPDDERRLEAVALQGSHWRTALWYAFLRELGMRPSEPLQLRWRDLCLEEGRETVTIREPKGRWAAALPFERDGRCGLFRRLQRRRPKASDHFVLYIRTDPTHPWSYRAALNVWRALCTKAKVEATPHQLRHTAATAWLRDGVDGEIVRRMLRHRSSAMIERYAELTPTDLRTALRRRS